MYPFQEIETKWQKFWKEKQCFRSHVIFQEKEPKPKYYVLDMFPYPSGSGLHVGHPEGYTASDIVARYKRMQGFNVMHPMGWDAFGLPAERYAMKSGVHPKETTAKNIQNFKKQLQSLGFSYDWEREINTTDRSYYKWTQWIFLKLFNSYYDTQKKCTLDISTLAIPKEIQEQNKQEEYKNKHRLAYLSHVPVNWCVDEKIVLANEEVDEAIEKGYKVERRFMKQWMLRITSYAQELLEGLKELDWPKGTLELQKNWIGRSEGIEISFLLQLSQELSNDINNSIENSPERNTENDIEDLKSLSLSVFTTRPDTIYGISYLVLAPEHPLVLKLTSADRLQKVLAYQKSSLDKSDLSRSMTGNKSKKSGLFIGAYAIHPLTQENLPIWISDYVLMHYGTGIVMGVPAHDERDFFFAKQFDLPILQVISDPKQYHSNQENTHNLTEERKKAREAGANMKEAYTQYGINIHSDILNGLKFQESHKLILAHLEKEKSGNKKIFYKLRDWVFSRQRYWGEPIPIVFKEGAYDEPIALDEKDLPLELPFTQSFEPAEDGQSPLACIDDWIVYTDEYGKNMQRESNTMPQWAGSSWYYLRYLDPKNDSAMVDPVKEKYWMGDKGVDLYIGGAEHAVLHLLYARFWHKVLYDLGYVSSKEPFTKVVHQGLILGEDGRKMSKSLGNAVNPDHIIEQYGADAFRMFEMFLGPLEQSKPWASKGIVGVFRFLDKVWRLFTLPISSQKPVFSLQEYKIIPSLQEEASPPKKLNDEELLMMHSTIKKITLDIENLSFHTAIAQLMIYSNFLSQKKEEASNCITKEEAKNFILLLHPFAPHITEELWSALNYKQNLTHEPWPKYQDKYTKESNVEIVFQVNGKVRVKKRLPCDLKKEELEAIAYKMISQDEKINVYTQNKEIKKIIVVPNRLVNIVAV